MNLSHLQALDRQRRAGRRKHTSPFTPNFDFEYEPPPVSLPTIEPSQAAAAFRAAMDQAEIEFLTSLWYSCYEPKRENI